MAEIIERDYETVSAVCDHCGKLCIFNRVSDIDEPGPYSGRYVDCLECKEPFWICGDIINPAYDLFISEARKHRTEKHYMLCIASLAQAWENFLSTFARANYLYHPYFKTPQASRDIALMNQLGRNLSQATRKFTFYPLRNLLINTLLKEVHPSNLQEAESAIRRIEEENFRNPAGARQIAAFENSELREIIEQLNALKVADLRNDVVHQAAYRPCLSEVEECLKELKLLYRIKHTLQVGEFPMVQFWHHRNN